MEHYAFFLKSLDKHEALLLMKCLESKYWGTCSNEAKLIEYCLYYLKPEFKLEYKHLNKDKLKARKKGDEETLLQQDNIIKNLFADQWNSDSYLPAYSKLKKKLNEIIADFELLLWIKREDVHTKIEREIFACRQILDNKKVEFNEQRADQLEKKLDSLTQMIGGLGESELKAQWSFELHKIQYFYRLNYQTTSLNDNELFFTSLLNMLYTHSSKHLITHLSKNNETPKNEQLRLLCDYLHGLLDSQKQEASPMAFLYHKLLPHYAANQVFNTEEYAKELEKKIKSLEKDEQANLIRIYHNILFKEYKADNSKIDDFFELVAREIKEGFIFTTNIINETQLFQLIDILDEYFLLRGNTKRIIPMAKKLEEKIGGKHKEFLKWYLNVYMTCWNNKPITTYWQGINVMTNISNPKVEVRRRLLQIKLAYARLKMNSDKEAIIVQMNCINKEVYKNAVPFLTYMEELIQFKTKEVNQDALDNLADKISNEPYFLYQIYLLAKIKELGGSRSFPPPPKTPK